jgi:hypothetical protein
MKFEHTRLFIARPPNAPDEDDVPQPRAQHPPPLAPSDAEEPTRFLAMERRAVAAVRSDLAGGVTAAGSAHTAKAGPVEPISLSELGDTSDLRPRFLRATWAGRARSAWRSLSLATRLSIALLPVAAAIWLPLAPSVSLGAQPSVSSSSAAARVRARSAPSTTPAPQAASAGALAAHPGDAPSPKASAEPTPRTASDAVAQGHCAEAVTRYRQLADLHPEIEAYREAARILQEQPTGCAEGK